jgi:hypothetical protein
MHVLLQNVYKTWSWKLNTAKKNSTNLEENRELWLPRKNPLIRYIIDIYRNVDNYVTFNNISIISVILWEETRVPGQNHQPDAGHWQTSSKNVVSCTLVMSGIRTRIKNVCRYYTQNQMKLVYYTRVFPPLYNWNIVESGVKAIAHIIINTMNLI